jgi:hypothetical protein
MDKDYLKQLKDIATPKKGPTILNEADRGDSDIHAEIAKFFVKNPSPTEDDTNDFCQKMGIDIDEFNKHLHMIMGEMSRKGLLKGYVNESILHELFINMAELSELDGDERNKKMLRLSIIAELDAANLYEQMANMSDNSNIKKVMLDVAKEEKVHAGEFESLLKKLDPEHEPSTEEGEKEVDEMTGEED